MRNGNKLILTELMRKKFIRFPIMVVLESIKKIKSVNKKIEGQINKVIK